MFNSCKASDGLCGPRKNAKKPEAHWADSFVEVRRLDGDPEHAAQTWEMNKLHMQQEDEVSRRLYAELDLMVLYGTNSHERLRRHVYMWRRRHYRTETNPEAPRGSQLHQEMVSDFVKKAMQRDEDLKAAVAADADVFQLFRTRSDADLAAVGLKRVPTGEGGLAGSGSGDVGGAGAGGSGLKQ